MISPTLKSWFAAAGALAVFAAGAFAADKTPPAKPAFEDAVQLAPFKVNGQKLSISVHARTASDRKYAEQFAEEVVGVAYETLGKSTGAGLVIIGREGEPHPVAVMRKFVAMAAAGELDPGVAAKAGELTALMTDWKAILHLDGDDPGEKGFKITFDMIMPALPLPLEGVASKLYQLSWAENFEDTRVERKLRALTVADLAADDLSKYNWVFYLPPRDAFGPVMDDVMQQGLAHEKMGLFKRAAVKTALFAFKPAIKTAVEGARKGVLFMTVLRARSDYSRADVMALTSAYVNVLMPDFKFNGGTEHRRALEAIEQQKIKNAEYAKDPYVQPARLANFDPAAYAGFEGDYGVTLDKNGKAGKPGLVFARKDDAWLGQYRYGKPLVLYPAGERLLVSADGKLTLEFKLDEQGAVTGVEERRERHRHTFPRKSAASPPAKP